MKVPKYGEHKIWERKGKLLPKNEEISKGKSHTNTWKFIRNILTITDVFLNQKRVNVCKTVMFKEFEKG